MTCTMYDLHSRRPVPQGLSKLAMQKQQPMNHHREYTTPSLSNPLYEPEKCSRSASPQHHNQLGTLLQNSASLSLRILAALAAELDYRQSSIVNRQ